MTAKKAAVQTVPRPVQKRPGRQAAPNPLADFADAITSTLDEGAAAVLPKTYRADGTPEERLKSARRHLRTLGAQHDVTFRLQALDDDTIAVWFIPRIQRKARAK